MKIFGRQTLKLDGVKSLPLWRGVFALLAIAAAWFLVAEIIGRTPLGYFLPPPSVGVDSFEFDTKVYYLEQSIRQNGPLDCLILGDSATNNGPDPRLVEAAYEADTGSSIHCFNFGMPALFLDASGPLAEALVNRFHPKLLIVILSVRDFEPSVDFPLQDVPTSEWAQHNLGSPSLRGWAVNSLYGYRYLLSLQYWLTPSNRRQLISTWRGITPEGFAPLFGKGESRELPTSGLTFIKTDSAQAGFDRLLALEQEGVNLLVVDAPIRPDLFSAHRENYFQPYLDYMQSSLAGRSIPLWLTEELSLSIDSGGWYDFQHLNEKGVPVLSTWLGTQLASKFPPEFFE